MIMVVVFMWMTNYEYLSVVSRMIQANPEAPRIGLADMLESAQMDNAREFGERTLL